jgi:uncharacterized caspase-like protein
MLIAFATDPGTTATDEGVYAEVLAEEMRKPGVLATEVFRAVCGRVQAATEHRQSPGSRQADREYVFQTARRIRYTGGAQARARGGVEAPPNQLTPVAGCDLYSAAPYNPER